MNKRWVYGVGVRNGVSIALYLDGALASNTLKSTNTARNETFPVMIGKRSDGDGTSSGNYSWFSGMIDEVQLSNVARSADWIKLSYESQKASASLVSLGAMQQASVGEDYATWSNSTPILLNTKASGANVATTVTKFPVLVRLNSGNSAIFTAAQTNGQDIRFAKLNGTHLPYQIEQWNSTAKTAAIWVLVDSIKGNDSASYFKMYYGKAGAADSSKGSAVFDTTNGFQAVLHLSEATGTNNDATINAYNGTPNGTTDSTGIIGSAKYFNGTASYIDLVGTAAGKLNFDANGTYTVSVWGYGLDTTNAYYVSKGDGHYSLYHRSAGALAFVETNTIREWVQTPSTGIPTKWSYIAGIRNNTAMALYVDGALVSTTIVTGTTTGGRNTGNSVQIGRMSGSTNYFTGKIDEVQIANVVRSADWIKLSYQNQKESQVLVSVGSGAPPVVVTPAVPVLSSPANAATGIAIAPALSWGTIGNAVTYRVQVATTSTFSATIADDSTLTTGTKSVSGLLNSTQYFWRVNAKNTAGTSAWSAPWNFTTVSTTGYKTKYVIIYVVDGSRYIETMGDTVSAGIGGGHSNIPYLWNILRPLGTLFTKMYCGGNNNTETCPGHASIVTGSWQAITNDGLERPHTPTIFEYYRKQKGAPANDCFYVGGKTKLNILQYSDSVGYGATYGANALIPAANRMYHDTTAWRNLQTVMNTYHPKLSIVNMAQTDSVGHAGSGNEGLTNASFVRYLGAIKQADSIAYKLWTAIQADTIYKNKTTLIITNDHGRHTTSLTGWISHGDQCDGCKHIMSLVIGPDTRANKVDSTTVQQIDYAPTIGKLMGFTTPYATGSLLQSVLLPPTQNQPKENSVVQNNGSYGFSKITGTNALVKIEFAIPSSGQVSLKMFDIAGRECATMVQGNLAAGSHSISVNTVSFANGAYVLRLTGTFGSISQKMLIGR